MDILLLVVKILVTIFASIGVAAEVYSNWHRLDFAWSVWKRIRVGMVLEVLAVIVLTITCTVLLLYYVPLMDWGWSMLLFEYGGNVLVALTTDASHSSNLYARLLVPVALLVLMACMPFLTHSEENTFRKGRLERKEIIMDSFIFGFIHMVVGAPLAAGLTLSGVGLFFAYKYKSAYDRLEGFSRQKREEEAVMVSTTYHTVYNTVLIGALLLISLTLV